MREEQFPFSKLTDFAKRKPGYRNSSAIKKPSKFLMVSLFKSII